MKRFYCLLFTSAAVLFVFSAVFLCSAFFSADAQAADGKAKNVIIFIGDGMGFNSNLAGTYYRFGKADQQRYNSFPVYLGCTTFSRSKKDQPIPDDCKGYDSEVFWESLANVAQGTTFTRTTDSAAASTAINSGTKTLNGSIGVNTDTNGLELISEVALQQGKKVGAVTTVPITHATPAGFSAHVKARGDMDQIFLQMTDAEKGLTVAIGAGHPLYNDGNKINVKNDESQKNREQRFLAIGGEKTWEKLSTGSYNGYTVIEHRQQFADLAQGKGTIPDKVIGIAMDGDEVAPADGFLEEDPKTQEMLNKSYQNRNWNELPTLTEMSLAALNVLTKNNEDGFVILIEGGAIDFANHNQNAERNCYEHIGFTKAIEAVLDWLEENKLAEETLVIVTADHETGQLWGENSYNDVSKNDVFDEGDGEGKFEPIKNNGRGKLPGMQYGAKGHTNALVPFWAKGPGSELFLKRVKGTDKRAAEFWNFSGNYIDNTDIAVVVKSVLAP